MNSTYYWTLISHYYSYSAVLQVYYYGALTCKLIPPKVIMPNEIKIHANSISKVIAMTIYTVLVKNGAWLASLQLLIKL